jgi:uncharacterized protein (TIGR03067 family)
MNFRTIDLIYVREGTLDLLDYHQTGKEWDFQYSIDLTAAPKTLDLRDPQSAGSNEPLALGIYEIDGDRMRICLARYLPSVKSDQRPKRFAIAPDSGDILFVLEPYQPSGDEKVVQGLWSVVSQTEDGKPLSKNRLLATTCSFGIGMIGIHEEKRPGGTVIAHFGGVCVLDGTKQPKSLTISEFPYSDKSRKRRQSLGIYKLDGNRLTLAYHQGEPRPEKFESKPGSGVTLLVLEKKKPAASASPPRTATETAVSPVEPPAVQPPKVPPAVSPAAEKPK